MTHEYAREMRNQTLILTKEVRQTQVDTQSVGGYECADAPSDDDALR